MDPDASDILEQVRRMCASEELRNKPLLRKLLTYLVTEYLEGRSDHIKGYSIAVDVFGQGTDFDADRNPLVRNNAVRLRALLRAYYLEEGKDDRIRIRVPKTEWKKENPLMHHLIQKALQVPAARFAVPGFLRPQLPRLPLQTAAVQPTRRASTRLDGLWIWMKTRKSKNSLLRRGICHT